MRTLVRIGISVPVVAAVAIVASAFLPSQTDRDQKPQLIEEQVGSLKQQTDSSGVTVTKFNNTTAATADSTGAITPKTEPKADCGKCPAKKTCGK